MFQPKVLSPTPDAWFVEELKKISPDLRVVWAYERYLRNEWAIELKTPTERYHAMYASIVKDDKQRFVEQPVYDDDRGGEQIGVRWYDLAPEYETVVFADKLDSYLIHILTRRWAWDFKHPISRAKYEEEERKKREAVLLEKDKKTAEVIGEATERAMRSTGKETIFGYGKSRDYIDVAKGDHMKG